MKYIDLHTHSTASDGTLSPRGLVEAARALGLAALAVTDHDTAAGVPEAAAAGAELGVELVPGIELSSDYRGGNIHILGYYIDPASPALREGLAEAARERAERNEKMVDLLAAAGYDISMAALREEYPGAVLGRPHFCEHLAKKGYISGIREGFDTLLGTGRPFFLPQRLMPMARAVALIRAAGGIPVLAHPFMYGLQEPAIRELLDAAEAAGVRHVEAYYSENSPEQEAWILREAERRGLGLTGGSDYHGSRKPHISLGTGCGNLRIPLSILEKLRAARP